MIVVEPEGGSMEDDVATPACLPGPQGSLPIGARLALKFSDRSRELLKKLDDGPTILVSGTGSRITGV